MSTSPLTPQQGAQLASTCPRWCEERPHDWSEDTFPDGRWTHSRGFGTDGERLTISALLDAHGQLVKVETTYYGYDGELRDGTAASTVADLTRTAAVFQQAAAFARDELSRIPSAWPAAVDELRADDV